MERMCLATLLVKYMLPNQVKSKPLETVWEVKILESMDSCYSLNLLVVCCFSNRLR